MPTNKELEARYAVLGQDNKSHILKNNWQTPMRLSQHMAPASNCRRITPTSSAPSGLLLPGVGGPDTFVVPSTATNPEAHAEANSMLASFPLRTRNLTHTAINHVQPKLESNVKGRNLMRYTAINVTHSVTNAQSLPVSPCTVTAHGMEGLFV